MSEPPSIEDFKIVVLGQPKVGKTSLVQRFVNENFYHQVPQLPQEEKKRVTLRNGKVVDLSIFDSAGECVSFTTCVCMYVHELDVSDDVFVPLETFLL